MQAADLREIPLCERHIEINFSGREWDVSVILESIEQALHLLVLCIGTLDQAPLS
jgi:hypothetical protein